MAIEVKGSPNPTRICLGTARFGSGIPEDQAVAVLDAYTAAGGNFLDTAHIYAAWEHGGWGASERLLGAWMAARRNRDRLFLATKGGHPPLDDWDRDWPGFAGLQRELGESLERLGVDWVDFYWLHRDDPRQPVGAVIDSVAQLMEDGGRIRAYGLSNWSPRRIAEAMEHAAKWGLPAPAVSQPGWALADWALQEPPFPGMRYFGEEDRRWHMKTQTPAVAYSAQAKGYFGAENAAWARAGFAGPPPRGREYDSPENRSRLTRAAALAEKKGSSANQIALAWLLAQPFPVYALVTTSQSGRMPELMAARNIGLSESERDFLAP